MNVAALYCGTRPVEAEDLQGLATINYGHFTVMRMQEGAVQGLDLHLNRLRQGHATLFDAPFDESKLRHALRTVLAGCGEALVRITGFARDFNYRDPLRETDPEWLISVDASAPAPAPAPAASPVSLKSFPFVRPLPQIKHVATLPLFHYRRLARQAGCDDALFVDGPAAGAAVVEGSVWNIGFWDGERVLWPEAPALRGSCEGLLQRGLVQLGVGQRCATVTLEQAMRLPAFTANANGCAIVSAINAVPLPADEGVFDLLNKALRTQPWDPI